MVTLKDLHLEKSGLTPLLLRVALALVFLYAAISSFANPQDWVGYLPEYARNHLSGDTLLHMFSIFELTLAVWLLSGRYVKTAALVAATVLGGIVLANFSLFVITFRDMALMLAALALFFSEHDK